MVVKGLSLWMRYDRRGACSSTMGPLCSACNPLHSRHRMLLLSSSMPTSTTHPLVTPMSQLGKARRHAASSSARCSQSGALVRIHMSHDVCKNISPSLGTEMQIIAIHHDCDHHHHHHQHQHHQHHHSARKLKFEGLRLLHTIAHSEMECTINV
eukprot:1663598-Amphidinium_carterae.1